MPATKASEVPVRLIAALSTSVSMNVLTWTENMIGQPAFAAALVLSAAGVILRHGQPSTWLSGPSCASILHDSSTSSSAHGVNTALAAWGSVADGAAARSDGWSMPRALTGSPHRETAVGARSLSWLAPGTCVACPSTSRLP